MSVKKMVELYLYYGLDSDTWDMMYKMACHGLITSENWRKFCDKCKDWELSESKNEVINSEGKVLYFYDDNGILTKA